MSKNERTFYINMDKPMPLSVYKRDKISILRQLGFHVDKSVFDKAKNEIQVDNIAHSIIVGQEKHMRKEDLIRNNAVNIAYQICNRIQTNNDRSEKPFVPGWDDVTKHRSKLIENIATLYEHPKKNQVLIEYLNMFAESEMLGG